MPQTGRAENRRALKTRCRKLPGRAARCRPLVKTVFTLTMNASLWLGNRRCNTELKTSV